MKVTLQKSRTMFVLEAHLSKLKASMQKLLDFAFVSKGVKKM